MRTNRHQPQAHSHRGTMPNNVETVDITPNYSAIHAGFLRDAESYSKTLVTDFSFENLHKWLAPITIALSAATTSAEVVEIREHLNGLLAKVAEISRRRDEGEGIEADWHVWVKPESDTAQHLVTISHGKRSICVDATLHLATKCVVEELQSLAEEAGEAEDA
jgi:hypothetical protein